MCLTAQRLSAPRPDRALLPGRKRSHPIRVKAAIKCLGADRRPQRRSELLLPFRQTPTAGAIWQTQAQASTQGRCSCRALSCGRLRLVTCACLNYFHLTGLGRCNASFTTLAPLRASPQLASPSYNAPSTARAMTAATAAGAGYWLALVLRATFAASRRRANGPTIIHHTTLPLTI